MAQNRSRTPIERTNARTAPAALKKDEHLPLPPEAAAWNCYADWYSYSNPIWPRAGYCLGGAVKSLDWLNSRRHKPAVLLRPVCSKRCFRRVYGPACKHPFCAHRPRNGHLPRASVRQISRHSDPTDCKIFLITGPSVMKAIICISGCHLGHSKTSVLNTRSQELALIERASREGVDAKRTQQRRKGKRRQVR